jgi:hypothetical protein
MRLDFPGRVLFVDDAARTNSEPVHAVEFGSEPFAFLTVWTKGQVAPFRETEHDPATFHRGDEKLSWVDEHYRDRKVRVLGFKQHFHLRGSLSESLAQVAPYMSPALREQAEQYLAGVAG